MSLTDVLVRINGDPSGAMRAFKTTERGAVSMGAGLRRSMEPLRDLAPAVGVASLVGMMSQATNEARDFGMKMAEVSTLLPDTKPMAALTEEVHRLSAEFGQVPTEQAGALYELLSSGAATAANATDMLTTANRLAVGGVTGVVDSVDLLTSVLNAYGPAVGTAESVSDRFFVAVKDGKTTVGELASTIGRVAPLAAQTGVSLDELLSGVAALTLGGQSTAEAMTGVRGVLAAVLKPSDDAAKIAKQLGIEFDVAAVKSKGLAGFLEDVKQKTGGNAEVLAKLFPDIEGLNAVLALTGKQGDAFAGTLTNMAAATGATGEAFNRVAESDAFKLKQALASISVSAVKLGGDLLGGVVPVAQAVAANFGTIVAAGEAVALLFGSRLVGSAVAATYALVQKTLAARAAAMADATAAVMADQRALHEARSAALSAQAEVVRQAAIAHSTGQTVAYQASIVALRAAKDAEAVASVRAAESEAALAAARRASTVAATAGATATRGFAAASAALGGPVGISIGILSLLALAYYKVGDSAEENARRTTEAVSRMQGQVGQMTMAQVEGQVRASELVEGAHRRQVRELQAKADAEKAASRRVDARSGLVIEGSASAGTAAALETAQRDLAAMTAKTTAMRQRLAAERASAAEQAAAAERAKKEQEEAAARAKAEMDKALAGKDRNANGGESKAASIIRDVNAEMERAHVLARFGGDPPEYARAAVDGFISAREALREFQAKLAELKGTPPPILTQHLETLRQRADSARRALELAGPLPDIAAQTTISPESVRLIGVMTESMRELNQEVLFNAQAWEESHEGMDALIAAGHGLEGVADAFGAIGEGASRALSQVMSVVEAMAALRQASKGGGVTGLPDFAGMLTGGLGLLSAGISIVQGLTAANQEHVAALRSNEEELSRVRLGLQGFRANFATEAKAQEALESARRNAGDGALGYVNSLAGALAAAGITLEQLDAIAKANNIELLDSKGNVIPKALAQLEEALRASALSVERFRDSVDGKRQIRDVAREVRDQTEPGAVLQDALAGLLDGLSEEAETRFGLVGLDLSTAEGKAGLEAGLRGIIDALEAGTLKAEDLGGFESVGELLSAITGTDTALDALSTTANKVGSSLVNVVEGFKGVDVYAFAAQGAGGDSAPTALASTADAMMSAKGRAGGGGDLASAMAGFLAGGGPGNAGVLEELLRAYLPAAAATSPAAAPGTAGLTPRERPTDAIPGGNTYHVTLPPDRRPTPQDEGARLLAQAARALRLGGDEFDRRTALALERVIPMLGG